MTSRGRILVVDDSALVRREVTRILSAGGFDVVAAKGGLEALRRLKRDPSIKAVTLDVSMPVLDGFETCRLLRKSIPGGEGLPVVLLTGNDPLSGRQKGLEVGATDFVVKGRARNVLLRVIEELVFPTRAYEGMNALLVHEEDRGIRMIQKTLRNLYGLSTNTVNNAADFSGLANQSIDLVAISGALTASDPLNLCAELRMRLGEDVPIFVVLDQASESRRLDCFHSGASDYLVAPILKEELSARLEPRLAQRLLFTSNEQMETVQSDVSATLRILVVDDTRLNRMVATALLGSEGHRVDTAEDGLPGLEKVDAARRDGQPYDLVLMDRYMPGMTGIETTLRLRHQERAQGHRELPVFGLTGTVTDLARRECTDAGMAQVLKKPLNIEAFREAISTLKPACVG